jgi:hypothetical protein
VAGRFGRVSVLLGAAVVLVAVGAGCSEREGGTPTLAPIVTTSSIPDSGVLSGPTTSEAGPSKPAGQSLAQIAGDFDEAVANRDFCGLLNAMNSDLPDTDNHDEVTETYRKVADSVRAARSFVPADLATQWSAVVDASENAAKAAARAKGQIDDPALQASFATSDFQQASVDLDAWNDAHCSPS